MGMDGHMATNTDLALLTLAQWFSPSFPVGGFHFSHGLEWDIDTGKVSTADDLLDWIDAVLCHGSGRNDAILLAATYLATELAQIREIDATARALAPSRERLMESTLMGEAFGRVAGTLMDQDVPALTYPVAVGYCAAQAGLPLPVTLTFFLQAFVANLASVGMRLIPIGQSDGQMIIKAMASKCVSVAEMSASGDPGMLGGSAFWADIASMQHETQYSRIFRT
jgi:urease accessory protein